MKTYNYSIDLMLPMQMNKEILFNEAQSKIDIFCNSSIIGFRDNLPNDLIVGGKYIIRSGEHAGYIGYCINSSKGWQLLKPKEGMIMFIFVENAFFTFSNNAWNKVITKEEYRQVNSNNSGIDEETFIGIDGKFEVAENTEHLYLYLNNDCELDLQKLKARQVTIILKQHHQNTYNLLWSHNILWKQKTSHIMTKTANSIDIIRLYRLIETKHFIGEIIGQDYKF